WMTKSELYGEHWLTAYEAYEHGWLTSSSDYIAGDPGFSHLRANHVRFYNERKRLLPTRNVGVLEAPIAVSQPTGAGATTPEEEPIEDFDYTTIASADVEAAEGPY